MNLPGFNAESSIGKSRRAYHGKYLYGGLAQSQSGLPAMVLPSQLEDIEGLDDADEFDLMDASEGEDEEADADETEFEE